MEVDGGTKVGVGGGGEVEVEITKVKRLSSKS